MEVPDGFFTTLYEKTCSSKGCFCDKCEGVEDCVDDFMFGGWMEIYPDNVCPEEVADFIIRWYEVQDHAIPFTSTLYVEGWIFYAFGFIPDNAHDARGWEPYMIASKDD